MSRELSVERRAQSKRKKGSGAVVELSACPGHDCIRFISVP